MTTRIDNDKALNELVADIKSVVLPEKVEAFLDARMTKFDKKSKTDAYISLKGGRKYLPYPFNVKMVAMLHSQTQEDEFDI